MPFFPFPAAQHLLLRDKKMEGASTGTMKFSF